MRVKVSGEFACFSRPEAKVERVSYEVPTPSAARGVLDAILWKPQMRWHILRISVLNAIRYQTLKRNEVQSKIPVIGKTGISAWMSDPSTYRPQPAGGGSAEATPRNTLALRGVSYIIEAEPVVFDHTGDNKPQKYISMFNRRVANGQYFHAPYLGCREFVAKFEAPSGDEVPIPETRELGVMLYDIIFDKEYKKNLPVFFHAEMVNGVVNVRAQEVLTAKICEGTADQDEITWKDVLACSCKR